MENFEFQNPVNLVFGKGQIKKINSLIDKNAKVLVITYKDNFIYKSGVMKQVQDALGDRKRIEWAKVRANPEYEDCLEAIKIARKEKVDFILAVGGGSVLDTTKFVSISAFHDWEEPWNDVFKDELKNAKGAIKFGSIMTLPATGSENNSGFVISWRAKGLKDDMFGPEWAFPTFSIIDPTTTLTLPAKQMGNGIVDSFTHVLEQYVATYTGSDVQDYFAAGLLRTIYNNALVALKDPKNYKARYNLSFASTMALNGFLRTRGSQDLSVHFMGHQVTALYGVDHGSSLLPIQIANYRLLKNEKADMLIHMGKYTFDITKGTKEEIIEKTINKVEEFFKLTGLPQKFSEYKQIQKDGKQVFVDNIIAKLYEMNLIPVGLMNVKEDKAREILALAYGGNNE